MKKILTVLLVFLSINIYSQDTHYWNIQYGTKSTLLGGAVIGSVSDLSATYYNPGAVSLFKDSKFVLSAKVFEYNSLTIDNAAGLGKDKTTSSIAPSPAFIAFRFKLDTAGTKQVAFSILTRQQMNYEFTTRRIGPIDLNPDEPGEEEFAGGISLEQDFKEIWAGITYSSQLTERIGFGATGYFAYRSQKKGTQTIIKVLNTDNSIASSQLIKNYDYMNVRALMKFGLGFDFRPLTLGFTVTTPSANVLGTGDIGNHYFLSGVDLDEDGEDDNRFESNYQEEVKSEFNSSWAVGFGGAYRINQWKFHFSAEWFDKVDKFNVLDIASYTSQSSGEVIQNELTHELKSVFNYGVGIDYYRSDNFIISLGFVTDFSARVPDTETNLSVSKWNLYHIAGGITFPVGKSDITVGLSYAFGKDDLETSIDLTPEDNGSSIIGQTSITELTSRRIKVLFGFNF